MNSKHTYILLIFTFFLIGCNHTKYIPEGNYLLKKNIIHQSSQKLDKEDLNSIILQQPNYMNLGVKWKLIAFNLIDSTNVAKKRVLKNQKISSKNHKRIKRQNNINNRRKKKSLDKGNFYYTERIISLKDTIQPKMFFREWYKYKIGEPPKIFDSILFAKSIVQLRSYLKNKGYYYGNVKGSISYNKKKCIVSYFIETGKQFKIDSIYFVGKNLNIIERYKGFLKHRDNQLINTPFDLDLLDEHRLQVSKYMRNNGFFGFSPNHISYLADTINKNFVVHLGVCFKNRLSKSKVNNDTLFEIPHIKTLINKVYFHISDTSHFTGSFSEYLTSQGLNKNDGQFLRRIDTTIYNKLLVRRSKIVDISRSAIFTHNGPISIKPSILEAQNYLEIDKIYSEKDLEKTYLSLLQLDLFQLIKMDLIETDDVGCVDAHYYLAPKKKQSFDFEPRATNSNGYLGLSTTLNYTNRNLFKGAENLIISLSGGFESQPPIFDKTIDGDKIQTAARSFNTFELSPSTTLEMPGFFPFRFSQFVKKMRPKTVFSTAYNFQKRIDFTQGTFQMNYLWKFFAKKTMIFQSGFPLLSVIEYVNIDKNDNFENKLNQINDLFLLNAYSNQFVWQDWKFTYEFNINERENRRGDSQLNFKSSIDFAGNFLSLFRNYQDKVDDRHVIFGISYAQFIRLDNNFVFSKKIKQDLSFNFRLTAGGGFPYGNSNSSLPYDYSFFAGGANDNRGWRTRALGPGTYKYYLDTNRSAIQIGDIRFGSSAEFRFPFNSIFKGAFFIDAGNIWTISEDPNRKGGKFSNNWYKEIAIAGGFGLRIDLEYFIIRVDIGFPIINPALPIGSKWVFQSRDNYYNEGIEEFGIDFYEEYLPSPFIPTFHFGIGYPF